MVWLRAIATILLGIFTILLMFGGVVFITSDYKSTVIELQKLKRQQTVCPTCDGRGIVRDKGGE